jgi:superfamily I DNA/RNA helicase
LLVVDETQDLDAAWIDSLLLRVRPDGKSFLLGDEDQRLFDNRAVWSDPGCVRIRCPDNFRNPRHIARTISALRLSSQSITPRCPLDGDMPGFHVWNDTEGGVAGKTAEVVDHLLAEGVKIEHIAVLSLRGMQSSQVLQQGRLGAHPLKRFTGRYDALGHAIWSEGALLADTVHRFKGQAAPVVVLTEMDFDAVDDRLRRRLFVGMTRAQWRLECVMSPRAERALAQILET